MDPRFDDILYLLRIDMNGDAVLDLEITLLAVDLVNLDVTDFTAT